ncbi:osmoprotectant transport system permease protein [Propionispira arboris]|uniref:Osmoprotectant transport system permease protein n=1 Tax=Propionispira arboris TaxID=84035 RepID=A0A1H6X6E0_9FIRM|nr:MULTISPECIES: ABC transporter permease [Propionispira]SEJ20422.1 osmoprotectant transport system permease protein [Propionispira arboris]
MLENFFMMLQNRWPEIIIGTWQHLQLTIVALFIANLIALPLGILLTRKRKIAETIIGITSVFQTIPSLALLGFMVPLFGIGFGPAIIALTVYGLLPILRNTYTGILGVDQSVIDAGTGMGMTSRQVLFMIELPLALPIIMAGIRTATVMVIGVATLAALVGAGGLGDLIFRGIAMARQDLILAGAIPAALLSVIFDYGLKKIEIAVQPKSK